MKSTDRFPRNIDWPSDENIKRIEKINPTVKSLKTLLYNGGLIYSFLYFVVAMFIEPMLKKQYLQRHDFSLSALLHLRRIIAQLQKRLVMTPVSALGYNEQNKFVERSTQTSDDNIVRDNNSHWPEIADQLQSVKQELQYYNRSVGQPPESMDDFIFQVKMVTDQIKLTDKSEKFSNKSRDVIQGIREIKGWFVNGQVPR
ncbi:pex17p [Saccharomyces arboricola H-6]|uniref:Pex17p n=1 Tax=Saccharomyces arboricola (strain H-6 / AS 2.3317 / CBS 10644) TaxID=1160507 RepID=J8Q0A9_SACAR|nr:pex17p [Saccharomyces arboricola H-6]